MSDINPDTGLPVGRFQVEPQQWVKDHVEANPLARDNREASASAGEPAK